MKHKLRVDDHRDGFGSNMLLLKQLFRHVKSQRRYQLALLIGLTGVSSVMEVISLGATIPFIGVLTQPEKIFNAPALSWVIQKLGIVSASDLVFPIALFFAMAACFAGLFRLALLWVSVRLSNAIGVDLSVEVYWRTLHQPYPIHIARSSGEVISGVTHKVECVTSVLNSFVVVVTSLILFVAILGTLFFISPMIASVSVVCFSGGYGIIGWVTRKRLKKNSQSIALQQTVAIKTLQEGLGAIRDILLDSSQRIYTKTYSASVAALRRAIGENLYITLAPRFVMETLGMVLIAFFAYSLKSEPGGIAGALPILGALALGAQRLMPLLQQIYGNCSVISGSRSSLIDVLSFLEQPAPESTSLVALEPLLLTDCIRFKDVSFQYSHAGNLVLKDVNITIPKGSRVGLIGKTGEGKSTAIDLLMGLLDPTTGKILIDEHELTPLIKQSWQKNIAHVPQSIYLADSTIAENIAFGVSKNEIDWDQVFEAANQAQIASYIDASAERYETMVGERGVRLSGGQRQRIGIARALYKKATVLLFDEATSALDSEVEAAVMETIDNLGRDYTVITIAHRLTTLRGCDVIYEISNKRIVKAKDYHELIKAAQSFSS